MSVPKTVPLPVAEAPPPEGELRDGPLPVNEVYGPTIQGEGPDIGRPCVFLRVHYCPVKCPGCDTAFTWNGKEQPKRVTAAMLLPLLRSLRQEDNQITKRVTTGLVVSGGEPLLYMRNMVLRSALDLIWSFRGLETSGYVGKSLDDPETVAWLRQFLCLFDTVCVSPKITPCLPGQLPIEELEAALPTIKRIAFIDQFSNRTSCPTRFVYKFVARDSTDIDAIRSCCARQELDPTHVQVMPYGNDPSTLLQSMEFLSPVCCREGWTLTPRLHALLWGAERLR